MSIVSIPHDPDMARDGLTLHTRIAYHLRVMQEYLAIVEAEHSTGMESPYLVQDMIRRMTMVHKWMNDAVNEYQHQRNEADNLFNQLIDEHKPF